MVVPPCRSPLTLPASTPLSWVVQPVSWLYQEHSVLFLPTCWEKKVAIKSPTCPDQTHTLQDRSTWEVNERTNTPQKHHSKQKVMADPKCSYKMIFLKDTDIYFHYIHHYFISFLPSHFFWASYINIIKHKPHFSNSFCFLSFFCVFSALLNTQPYDLNRMYAFPMAIEREPGTVSTSSFCSNVYFFWQTTQFIFLTLLKT